MYKLRYYFLEGLDGHFQYISAESWDDKPHAESARAKAYDEISKTYGIKHPYVYINVVNNSLVLDLGLK